MCIRDRYYECSRGIDERPVEAIRIRKSIGCERTLERDISARSSVIIELYHVAVAVSYTHLDVYKRQSLFSAFAAGLMINLCI